MKGKAKLLVTLLIAVTSVGCSGKKAISEVKQETTAVSTTTEVETSPTTEASTTDLICYEQRDLLNETEITAYRILQLNTTSVVVYDESNQEVDYLFEGDYIYTEGIKFDNKLLVTYFKGGTSYNGWVPYVREWYSTVE